jgi:hypothetical protein
MIYTTRVIVIVMFVPIFMLLLRSALFCDALSSTLDRQQVFEQMGYVPTNFVSVVARAADGTTPVVLQTYPLAGGSARRQARSSPTGSTTTTPFPTLFWLCNSSIHKAVADLERRGYVQRIEQTICASEDLCSAVMECHRQYAADRWNSLTPQAICWNSSWMTTKLWRVDAAFCNRLELPAQT